MCRAIDTNGISLSATDAALPATLGASIAHGAFLNAATAHFPAVVLGAEAASLLGIETLAHPTQVWIGGHWFTVVGILNPVQLVSQMDSMAFIGFPIAEQYFGFDGHPTELFLRSAYTQVSAVAAVLPETVNPAESNNRGVDRAGGHLEGGSCGTKGAYNGLFLALGAVACSSAGLASPTSWSSRSSNGARRSGCAGRSAPAGATSPSSSCPRRYSSRSLEAWPARSSALASTAIYARSQDWSVQIPAVALYGGVGAALVIGACCRPVPIDAGRPPVADRSTAHGMSPVTTPGHPEVRTRRSTEFGLGEPELARRTISIQSR